MRQQVISFHYTLKDKEGKTLDSSHGRAEPLMFLAGSGQIIKGLDQELSKLNLGDKKVITLAAAEAYGESDGTLILDVPREQLPAQKEIQVGDQFSSQSPDGHTQVFRVISLSDKSVTLDGNHPLAGQELTFDVEVVEKRDATDEEISHGHVHGAHGHHH